jgi:hypothetical protein
METLIAHPENEQQAEAVKAVLKALNIPFEEEKDTTEHLLSTEANTKKLNKSIEQIENGKVTTINLDDVWK